MKADKFEYRRGYKFSTYNLVIRQQQDLLPSSELLEFGSYDRTINKIVRTQRHNE